MPEVPGFGVLKWMRTQPEYAGTPVVVFSSSRREEDRARARELGANDFMEKPNLAAEFGTVVDRLRAKIGEGASDG